MARNVKNSGVVNIKVIAEQANCSPSTVSRVLSGHSNAIKISAATEKKILDICEKLDYHPSIHASRLFSSQSRVVGLLIIDDGIRCDDNLSKSMFGAFQALLARGYRTLPLFLDEKFVERREYLRIFKRREVDALIVWGAREENIPMLDEIKNAGYPMVLLSDLGENYISVSSNQFDAAYGLAKLCRDSGAERITVLSCDISAAVNRRRLGAEKALEGMKFRSICSHDWIGDGDELFEEVWRDRPQAIVCVNDYQAVKIVKRLLECGVKVPDEVIVTGGDNIMLSEYCQIPITTFDQEAHKCACNAVDMLVDFLEKNVPMHSVKLPTTLIERESTGHRFK